MVVNSADEVGDVVGIDDVIFFAVVVVGVDEAEVVSVVAVDA